MAPAGTEALPAEEPASAAAASTTVDTALSVVDLPDELLSASRDSSSTEEEKWAPLPGEVGYQIEIMARTALGDLVPPEPPLDFDLLAEIDGPRAAEATADSIATTPEDILPSDPAQTLVEPPRSVLPSPAAEAAARRSLPQAGHMAVGCPACSNAGLVRWDQLGGILCCSECWTWFRMGADGNLTAVAPDPAIQAKLRHDRGKLKSEPSRSKRPLAAKNRHSGGRRHGLPLGQVLAILVPIAFLAVLVYLGVRWWSKPSMVKLPVEVDRRARLVAESWLKHDVGTMLRMTHRNHRGPTRAWVNENRSPLPSGRFDSRKTVIDSRVIHQDENTAETEVRVELPGNSSPIVLRHQWERLDGSWLCKPPRETHGRPPVRMQWMHSGSGSWGRR